MHFVFAELTWPHKEIAVHPNPLQIYNVHHYESIVTPGRIYDLEPVLYYVGTDETHRHVIGVFLGVDLYPLIARRKDLDNQYGRVKMLISGDIANDIVPILASDPLNSVFSEGHEAPNIRAAEFHA